MDKCSCEKVCDDCTDIEDVCNLVLSDILEISERILLKRARHTANARLAARDAANTPWAKGNIHLKG